MTTTWIEALYWHVARCLSKFSSIPSSMTSHSASLHSSSCSLSSSSFSYSPSLHPAPSTPFFPLLLSLPVNHQPHLPQLPNSPTFQLLLRLYSMIRVTSILFIDNWLPHHQFVTTTYFSQVQWVSVDVVADVSRLGQTYCAASYSTLSLRPSSCLMWADQGLSNARQA